MSDKPSDQIAVIDMREDGPLLVKNHDEIILADGPRETLKPATALCRCGASSNKPYCDGTHRECGYTSENTADASKDKPRAYTGEAVSVFYNRLLCSHAGECAKRAGAVFDTSKKPWVQPDNGSVDDIRDAVAACPSGALRIAEGNTKNADDARHLTSDEVSITVTKDGPYEVRNVPTTADLSAAGQTQAKYVLCRCGKSSNTPFCDGSHRDASWSDEA